MRPLLFLLIAGNAATAPLVFRNTAPEVGYAGSKSCMPCHKAIYDNYVRTAMGRSVTRPAAALAPVTA